ncbi:methyltransferase family protein [Rhodocaloribacter sp.]
MESRGKSYVFVAVQFACIFYLLATGRVWPEAWGPRLMFLFGVALGLYAVAVMRLGRFNVTPDVRPDAELRVHGPYRWIRHPMYTSVLLTMLALVWGDCSLVRLGVWALLALDLVLKMRYEEHLLSEKFEAYAEYRRRTKRLIPWVY